MKPRILVVEDNEVLRRPLQRTLQTSGYEVLVVGPGEEARLRVEGALLKPFEPDQLLAVIEQALAQGWPLGPLRREAGSVSPRPAARSGARRHDDAGRPECRGDAEGEVRVGGVVAWETHSTIGEANAG